MASKAQEAEGAKGLRQNIPHGPEGQDQASVAGGGGE